MIIIQVLIGGITRLTGSGLSITEWEVITGALPPRTATGWAEAFEKYRQTPQYTLLNSGFTLEDFKFIYFWEWFHRLWARLIGVVFLIPFVIFLFQKRFRPSMVRPMIVLFLLGGLQGAVGWIMVASGLTGDAIYVAPVRLALHFLFALVLLAYTFWFALTLWVRETARVDDRRIYNTLIAILALLALQLIYGALMAGHKAAPAAATWPDINGSLIPPQLGNSGHGWLDLVENRITIHFIHRGLAYVLVAFLLWLTIRLYRLPATGLLRRIRALPLFAVLAQTCLGILSVLSSRGIIPNQWGRYEWLAQLHQLTALLLLLALVSILYLVRPLKRPSLV
jgi:cytochrome c oxidase assembly protein subunit 15